MIHLRSPRLASEDAVTSSKPTHTYFWDKTWKCLCGLLIMLLAGTGILRALHNKVQLPDCTGKVR